MPQNVPVRDQKTGKIIRIEKVPYLFEHPQIQIAALEAERDRHGDNPDIDSTIERLSKLPQSPIPIQEADNRLMGQRLNDREAAFLDGLKREYARAGSDDQRASIQAEIDKYETHEPSLVERAVTRLPKRTQKAIKVQDDEES